MDTALSPTLPASPDRKLSRFTLVRILLALLAVCVPVALVLVLSNQIPDKALRAYWPPLLAALAGYVRDRRGQDWIVTAFVNDPQAGEGRGRAVLDRLILWVAEGNAAAAELPSIHPPD